MHYAYRGRAANVKTIGRYFKAVMEEGIRESHWFRSAPLAFQATATIKMVGVEDRHFRGLGTSAIRPALVAECTCGGEVQRFSLSLDNTTSVCAVDH